MRKAVSAILASLMLIMIPATVFAAGSAPATVVTPGLTISPAIKQITLAANQNSVSFNTQITNNTSSQVVVNISTTDFKAVNEVGGIVFLPNLTNRPHGLAQWLKPGETQVVLPANSGQTVPIVISPIASLAPGGHYGAIVYNVGAPSSGAKGNQVGNNQAVTSLVFLTTASGGIQSVKLGNLPISRLTLKIPSSVNLVLTNTGNTQVAPSGVVTILDHSNKEVARGIINPDSGLVLPDTSRLYTVSLRSETSVDYPGKYRLVVAYQANGRAQILTYNTSFVLVNQTILVASALLIVLVVVLLIRRFSNGIVYRRRKP